MVIFPHLLGLDAPFVAVGWQLWWARLTHVRLGWPEHAVLFLAVWAIYLADRLADGLALAPAAVLRASARHRFARQHRRPLLALLAVLVGVALPSLALLGLRAGELRAGLVLLALQTGYFVCIHAHCRVALWDPPPWLKEAWVGLSFAVGSAFFVGCGTAARGAGIPAFFAAVGGFAALCFLNCALISQWESSPGRAGPALRSACLALTAATLAALPVLGSSALPLAFGALGLWMLDAEAARFLPADARRVLADVALLSPWLLLG